MSCRACVEADEGSMRASTRRVTGKSLRAGRKFLTPEMRLSSPTPPMPPSRMRSPSCEGTREGTGREDGRDEGERGEGESGQEAARRAEEETISQRGHTAMRAARNAPRTLFESELNPRMRSPPGV